MTKNRNLSNFDNLVPAHPKKKYSKNHKKVIQTLSIRHPYDLDLFQAIDDVDDNYLAHVKLNDNSDERTTGTDGLCQYVDKVEINCQLNHCAIELVCLYICLSELIN